VLPGVPASGICGAIYKDGDLAKLRAFRTTQNELTIQFVTDNRRDNKAGNLRQVSGFLQVLRFPPPIKLTAMI
jgi:hypothetical protein